MAVFVDWKKVYRGRIWAKIKAPFVVPFLDDAERILDETYGCRDTSDTSWWNIAIRNGAHNYGNRPLVEYTEDVTIDEKLIGTQKRTRRTKDGQFFSYRKVWGDPRPKKGKKEFYYGWVPNDDKLYMRASIQFRPF